jgi:hypothetical protein
LSIRDCRSKSNSSEFQEIQCKIIFIGITLSCGRIPESSVFFSTEEQEEILITKEAGTVLSGLITQYNDKTNDSSEIIDSLRF